MTNGIALARSLFPDRERRSRIWHIALPITGGMLSQNILNLVDVAMVGRLGDDSLAASAIGSFINYLAIAFVIGLAAGVQALAARRLGEGRTSETAIPLNGGLFLALLIGVPLCILAIAATPWAFRFLTGDAAVAELGIPYLQARLAGMVAVGMMFSFRGYWSAVHMARVYLRTQLLMHAINIFLHWVLIFGKLGAPALGVFGAGLSTTISLYIGTAACFYYALHHDRPHGFMQRIPSRQTLMQQLRVSLPASLQQLFFSGGLVTLAWIVGQIGTAEVAAVNVLMTFHITALMPVMGLALASATLVGNALGRGDEPDAVLWGWNSSALAFLYGLALSLVLVPLAHPILGLFLGNAATRDLAWLPMVLWASVIGFDAVGMVLMNALLGAGATHRSMWITLIAQWGFFLPVAWLVGPVLGLGLAGVWAVNALYRFGQALYCVHAWRSRRWVGIKL